MSSIGLGRVEMGRQREVSGLASVIGCVRAGGLVSDIWVSSDWLGNPGLCLDKFRYITLLCSLCFGRVSVCHSGRSGGDGFRIPLREDFTVTSLRAERGDQRDVRRG